MATIGIPTIAMVLLLLLPFYDRNPERRPERRPIATTAGILTIIAIAYLTYLGATAGRPRSISRSPRSSSRARRSSRRRAAWPAKLGENGNNGPGPELTQIGENLPRNAIARSLEVGPGSCPPTGPASAEARSADSLPRIAELRSVSPFPGLTSPRERRPRHRGGSRDPAARFRAVRDPGPRDVRPDRRGLRPDELRDDRGAPPPVASGRSTAPRSVRAPTRSTSAAAPGISRWRCAAGSGPTAALSAVTSPSRCSSWLGGRAARRGCRSSSGGRTRSIFPTARRASTRSRSASAPAIWPTCRVGSPRWRGSSGHGAGS